MAVKIHIIYFSLATFLNDKKSHFILSICPQQGWREELMKLVILQDINVLLFIHLRTITQHKLFEAGFKRFGNTWGTLFFMLFDMDTGRLQDNSQ